MIEIGMSLLYLAAASALLFACIAAYVWFTPYRELALIQEGNVAAGLSLFGAVVGLALPIASAIFFTHDFLEMTVWAAVGCGMQMLGFTLMREIAKVKIPEGNIAVGLLLCGCSIATGVLVASCIS